MHTVRALLDCSGFVEQAGGELGVRKQSQEFNAIQSSAKPHALQRCGREEGTESPSPQPSGRMMDLSGWGMRGKNSEHNDPPEELGEGAVVNGSAPCLPLRARASVLRMSDGLPCARGTAGDTAKRHGAGGPPLLHSLSAGFLQVSPRGFSEPKHIFPSSVKSYFSFRCYLKWDPKTFWLENIRVVPPNSSQEHQEYFGPFNI